MPQSSIPITMKAILKIEKYEDGVTQEEIEKGLVSPIEVVESEDKFEMEEDKVNQLFDNE